MSVELSILAWLVALLFVLILIQGYFGITAQGPKVMGGARDSLKPPTVMQARTKRLVDNHREGLWLFAPLVLIAAISGISNSWTVLGAQIYLAARVLHAIIYLAGWPMVRPLVWFVGLSGPIMIFLALFGILQ